MQGTAPPRQRQLAGAGQVEFVVCDYTIEETYRDSKRGYIGAGFGLHALKRLRPDRLARLRFCLGLVYGFLVLLAESERNLRAELWRQHFRLSLISYAFDALQAAPTLLRRMVKHACAR